MKKYIFSFIMIVLFGYLLQSAEKLIPVLLVMILFNIIYLIDTLEESSKSIKKSSKRIITLLKLIAKENNDDDD